LRLIFAGTPEFAAVALRRLVAAGHDIALVLTQPDRPAGRGMQLQASPVKQAAQAQGIAVCQPRSLRLEGKFPDDAEAARQAIQMARADGMVVAAYGLILPQWVLDTMAQPSPGGPAALGCLNIHASLLPRWRGAAPIHRAIEAGDREAGICIMQMDAGLDTGAVLLQAAIPIQHEGPQADTTGSLHDRLADLGGDLIVRALALVASGGLQARAQSNEGVSYADKVQKPQARVDWSRSAEQIERGIRAFDPNPGAWTTLGPDMLKLWRARVSTGALAQPRTHPPGTVLTADAAGIAVACGEGVLCLLELQRAGGKRLAAADFLRGQPLAPGARLGADDER
jgi:methionyl-tRNA formyltransferase